MSKLVLLGGAPGVGKTTLLKYLPRVFENCACLDADDVWRVQPIEIDEAHRAIAVDNVVAVLRGYLTAGYSLVFLGWVLARPEMVDRVLAGLEGLYESSLLIHLVAAPEALATRSREKLERGLLVDYQALKVRQIEALPTTKLDTTSLEPAAVAAEIRTLVERSFDQEI